MISNCQQSGLMAGARIKGEMSKVVPPAHAHTHCIHRGLRRLSGLFTEGILWRGSLKWFERYHYAVFVPNFCHVWSHFFQSISLHSGPHESIGRHQQQHWPARAWNTRTQRK